MVPPSRYQAPTEGDNVKVLLPLFRTPTRLTVLPLALKLPSPAVLKVPLPRFTVELVAVMRPLFVQVSFRVSVPPLSAWSVPLLLQLAPLTVTTPPAVSAEMVPWLIIA